MSEPAGACSTVPRSLVTPTRVCTIAAESAIGDRVEAPQGVAAAPVMVCAERKQWREGDSRSERGRLIREPLFKAAAEIVGDVGYQAASVAMITGRG